MIDETIASESEAAPQGRYLALSRYPLQPRLVRRLPESFARANRVVPLTRRGDRLIVAMANPEDREALLGIRKLMACDVHPVPVGEAEIQVALDRVFAPHEAPGGYRTALRVLLETGFLARNQALTLERELAGSPTLEAGRFPLGGVLTEEEFVEAMGLALYLPRLRLSRWKPSPALTGLIPVELAQRWRLVALFLTGGELVLASPTLPSETVLQEVARSTGFDPYPVLCTPSEADAALSDQGVQAPRLPGGDQFGGAPTPEARSCGETSPAARSIWEELLRCGVVDRGQLARANTIALNTGEPVEEVLLRLGVIDEYDLLEVRARLLGTQPVGLDRARIDRSLLSQFPEPLARRFRCIPLNQMSGRLNAAMVDVADETARKLLETLYGLPVQPFLCREAELEEAVDDLYSASRDEAKPQDLRLEEYLLLGGRLTVAQIKKGLQQQRQSHEPLWKCLMDQGHLDEAGVAEAMALQLRIPWATVSRYGPSTEALSLLPEESARQHQLLPLYREGRLLTVAVADPEALEKLTAAQSSGARLRVVAAGKSAIEAAIDRLYGVDLTAISPAIRGFGESMVASGLLSREQLLQAWRQQLHTGQPFDLAITSLGYLSEQQLARALASHLRVPLAELHYRSVPVEVVDALGMRLKSLRWIQPLDPDVARLLREESATRLNAIPIRRDGDAVAVAFVNPLEGAPERVQEELGRPVSVFVSTRSELSEALRRVHGRPALGDLLVEQDVVSRSQLDEGLRLHRQTGVPLGKALVSLGHITQEQLVNALSEQQGLPYFSLSGARIDEEVARCIPEALARERGLLPLARVSGSLVLAMTNPLDSEAIAEVERSTGCRVEPVITTEKELEEALERIYRGDYLWRSANDLVYRYPDDSAMRVLTGRQKTGLLAALGLSILLAVTNPVAYFTWVIAISTLFYLAFSTYKFYLIFKAISHTLEVDVTPEDVAVLAERDLPIYTVLVPLYREAEVLPTLINAMGNLDYPKAKLDVKLLLEEDDRETIEAVRYQDLPDHFKVVVVPNALPKGKPKACNYGLIHAEGEYVVIYDAEDIPDRDQLKKVVAAFRKADSRVECIQAKLNYYNRDQNLLTRWFTTEYSMWFDLFIPGLDASNSPIPLGGTSNHFRTARLREMGGWDPYNVTEDADLGVRLFKAGWKTAVVDSTTYEEANSELYNWIRQRSRWVKGYVQTYLVHMRHPLKLMRDIGPYQFFSFNMVIGGTFFGFLMNPVFWALTAVWYMTRWDVIQLLYPPYVFYLGALGLYIGNFAFMYTNVAGCLRRGYYDMVKYALISPLYWALMSIGAWKGFIQLFYRPSYWEKTKHGLYQGEIKTAPATNLGDLL